MDALACLTTRRSVRQFTGAPVRAEHVATLIDAARLAPTANNLQPWLFITVTDPARLRALAALCPRNAPFLPQAGLAVLVTADGDANYAVEDGSAAVTNLLNAAHALGYGGCWVAGHGKDYAPAVLQWAQAPAGQRLIAIAVVGVPAAAGAATKKERSAVWRRERGDGEAGA